VHPLSLAALTTPDGVVKYAVYISDPQHVDKSTSQSSPTVSVCWPARAWNRAAVYWGTVRRPSSPGSARWWGPQGSTRRGSRPNRHSSRQSPYRSPWSPWGAGKRSREAVL